VPSLLQTRRESRRRVAQWVNAGCTGSRVQVCREMPHISNMYFLEEVITVRALRSAVAEEFRKISTNDLKVRSFFLRDVCVSRRGAVRRIWHKSLRTVLLPAGVGNV
jgi:hypothetical protein